MERACFRNQKRCHQRKRRYFPFLHEKKTTATFEISRRVAGQALFIEAAVDAALPDWSTAWHLTPLPKGGMGGGW